MSVFSNTGKRLMAKCRLLYQENEELGRMIASGRIAKLEGDLALQRSFSEEMKKSQSGTVLYLLYFLLFVSSIYWNELATNFLPGCFCCRIG